MQKHAWIHTQNPTQTHKQTQTYTHAHTQTYTCAHTHFVSEEVRDDEGKGGQIVVDG